MQFVYFSCVYSIVQQKEDLSLAEKELDTSLTRKRCKKRESLVIAFLNVYKKFSPNTWNEFHTYSIVYHRMTDKYRNHARSF